MSWQNLELLLNNVFDRINTNNRVPSSNEIWLDYEPQIRALLGSNANQQFLRFSSLPETYTIKSVEIARLLFLLKQRFTAGGNAKPLVGRIRVAVVPRERPPFNVATSDLSAEMQSIAIIGRNSTYSQFQVEGWRRVRETIERREGLVVVAPTGAGKSEVFMLPIIQNIAQHINERGDENNDPRFIMLYPRVELLKDQLSRIFKYVYWAERTVLNSGGFRLGRNRRTYNNIIIGFQFSGIAYDSQKTLNEPKIFETRPDNTKVFRIVDECPICEAGVLVAQNKRNKITPLSCDNANCDAVFHTTISKPDHVDAKSHILVTTDESLARFYLTPRRNYDDYLRSITGIVFDEAHLYYSLHGAHLYNLIANIERLQSIGTQPQQIAKIASSATITNPERFAAKLFYGREYPPVQIHNAIDYPMEPSGLEVIYFVQAPDVENFQVTSTMIQGVMGIGHGVFARRPVEQMERAILFTDSVDNARRFQRQIQDAELSKRLWSFRTILNDIQYNGSRCPNTDPARCPNLYQQGECWRGIVGGENCVTTTDVRENPITINQISSQTSGTNSYWNGEVIVATSTLEVGVDDSRIKTIFHFRPPRDVFSFIQRRGRAGRGGNELAHSAMILGNEASDQFYLYRRNRLLSAGSYELPLNPQNEIVARMHETLRQERDRLYSLTNANGSQRGNLLWFFNTLSRCPEINRLYGREIENIRGNGEPQAQQRQLVRWFRDERAQLEQQLNVIWTLEEIENQCSDALKIEAQEIRRLVIEFLRGDRSLADTIRTRISHLTRGISDLITDIIDQGGTESEYLPLQELRQRVEAVWFALHRRTRATTEPELLRGLYDFFRVLNTKFTDHGIFNSDPDVLRTLLQAFFYLGLETRKQVSHRTCESCLEFRIPNTFFQQVKPLVVELRTGIGRTEQDSAEEGVTSLATMFYPYKTFYRYFGVEDLSVLDTISDADSVRQEDNTTVVSVRLHGDGLRSDDTFMPQRIYVKPIRSNNEGNGVVKICQVCFSLYGIDRTLQCHHRDLTPVKLYARPIIQRRGFPKNETVEAFSRTLDFLQLDGDTTVSGSHVDASTMQLQRDANGNFVYRSKGDRFRFEFRADYDRSVSYRVPTKGIRWNLSEIIECVTTDASLQEQIGSKILNAELVAHTAAHMLYKAVASISGVNQDVLEYAINDNFTEVLVWERYEGGAGISETIRESFRTDPVTLYKELLAVALCPVNLDQDLGWATSDDLRQRIASQWFLSERDGFLSTLVLEAEAERRAGALQEIAADHQQPSCIDGCPVCIQVTTCTAERDVRDNAVSRAVAERILSCLIRSVNSTEMQMLMNESISRNVATPMTLSSDPDRGISNVLLL